MICTLRGGGGTERFTATGHPSPVNGISGDSSLIASGSDNGVGVDPINNDVYVSTGGSLEQYTESGVKVSIFGSEQSLNGLGIAIDGETGELFLANDQSPLNGVLAYSPLVTLPTVITKSASQVGYTSATVSGELNPEGIDVDASNPENCKFEYVEEAAYNPSAENPYSEGSTAECSPTSDLGAGTIPVPVTASLAGLRTVTTYHYRLVVKNSNGTEYGSDNTFSTIAVLGVTTDGATNLTTTEATLNGDLNPNGLATHFYFEYGATTNYGTDTTAPPGVDLASGGHSEAVSEAVTELTPGATYHYRLVTSNSNGITYGADQTFTLPQPPLIAGVRSTNLTETSADIHATINPEGYDTTYFVEYGRTVGYGSVTPLPHEGLGAGDSGIPVSVTLKELQPKATYHFRIVATSKWGTEESEDQSFSFFPPNCPNEELRQQTGSEHLPDCRAYELVSPSVQGNVVLIPEAAPWAPNATDPARFAFRGKLGAVKGTDPPNSASVDTYVSTRSATGWSTKYVGLPGNKVYAAGKPFTDEHMDKLLDYQLQVWEGEPPASSALYLWNAEDEFLGRWPAGVESLEQEGGFDFRHWRTSATFSHLAFTAGVPFAPGGASGEDGSAYDYNTATDETALISSTAAGEPVGEVEFPGEGGYSEQRRGLSADGSHILMASDGVLYMRVADASTLQVSAGHAVEYIGMTADGK